MEKVDFRLILVLNLVDPLDIGTDFPIYFNFLDQKIWIQTDLKVLSTTMRFLDLSPKKKCYTERSQNRF